MSCKIIATQNFKKSAKKLAKKYASLKDDLTTLQHTLLENPRAGTLITENTYKIRLAVKSKGKGKSGGLRIITHVLEVEIELKTTAIEQKCTVFLMAIYDKSSTTSISKNVLKEIIEDLEEDLDL